MKYIEKTCHSNEDYYVGKNNYKFNKFVVSKEVRTGYVWDKCSERWIPRYMEIKNGVNKEFNHADPKLYRIDEEADRAKGYSPYDFFHY